jgi:cellulose synthase/poly-beta-1,6-N-acetylglucosamine synthase-like glycosyltransferase
VLQDNFANNPRVKLCNKINEGKSAAVNYGLMRASGEIMVSLDADTLISPDTIKLLVRHFSDPKVGGVAGNAKVGNRGNVLTKFQALEYITSQNLDRRAFDILNAITVVPGAIGAWRIDLVKRLGGLDDRTLAEDSDLTLNMIEHGYTIHFEAGGLAYTEAPMNLKDLASQRFRWAFGTLQVLIKNKMAIANPKYKWLGMWGLPNIFLFQVFSPVITPIVDLEVILLIGLFAVEMFMGVRVFSVEQFAGLFTFAAIYNVIDFSSSIWAFSMEKRENWKLLLWLIPQRIFYRFFLNWICLKSLVSALKGNAIGWNKLDRIGNLKSDALERVV